MQNILDDNSKKIIFDSIRDVPDFPKPGIVFKDITTLLNNPKAFKLLMDHLENRYKAMDLDYIVGLDARGFIFGSILADRLGIGFVPVRKKGKLPSATICEKYELEYGFDEVEVHIDAFGENGCCKGEPSKVLLIDDLIATGGTANAAATLIQQAGAKCVACCCIVGLTFLDGLEKLEEKTEVYSVVEVK